MSDLITCHDAAYTKLILVETIVCILVKDELHMVGTQSGPDCGCAETGVTNPAQSD
jgi:hypothetical protein